MIMTNPRRKGPSPSTQAAKFRQVHDLVTYVTRNESCLVENGERVVLTNCADENPEKIIGDMQNFSTVADLANLTKHVVISLEKEDRALTAAEWQRVIDIYFEERGIEKNSNLFAAVIHTDGNKEKRNPQHMHLVYTMALSNGRAVPTKMDSHIHRAASRLAEKDLGLIENAGANPDAMFNGRNRHENRDRAAERRGFTEKQSRVDPEIVARAINSSRSVRDLRYHLAQNGIEFQARKNRQGEIYAWKLRMIDGPPEWTSGSKLSANNDFGWGKVIDQLDRNAANSPQKINSASIQKHGARQRLGRVTKSKAAPRPIKRLDDAVDQASGEALAEMMKIIKSVNKTIQAVAAKPRPAPRPAAKRATPIARPTPARPRG